MDSAELTTVLREAAGAVDPPAGFADAVLRGGRRRRRRRRLTIAATVIAVLVVLAGGTTAVLGDEAPQVASRGDLGNDQEFLDQVIATWQVDGSSGDPRVYWAGNTPAGKAAVLMQEAYLDQNDLPPKIDRQQTLIGLVATDPADGELKMVGAQYRGLTGPYSGYFQFGDGDRTLLFVDYGTPIYVSPKQIDLYGAVSRNWQRVPVEDGVAITELPRGTASTEVIAVARNSSPSGGELQPRDCLPLRPASEFVKARQIVGDVPPHPSGLPWHDVNLAVGRNDLSPVTAVDSYTIGVAKQFGTADTSAWHITAGLPDGGVAILGDHQSGFRPAQIYVRLVDESGAESLVGEVVDRRAALPVKFRMPDKQGWVIADYRKSLSYRTTVDGPWQDAGTSAALVPDETVQVLVDSTTVNLPR